MAMVLVAGTKCLSQPISDTEIASALTEQYSIHPAIKSENLEVSCADGVIYLSGSFWSLAEKEKAIEIAESMRGVRTVVDNTKIALQDEVPDNVLEQNITKLLKNNAVTSNYNVNARSTGGIVELTGKVSSFYAKRHSERIAKSVNGVKSITNNITVEKGKTVPDQQLKTSIESSMKMSSLVDDSGIKVNVSKGKVVLSGIVNSAIEKTAATEMAWIKGVNAVDSSQLQVDPYQRKQEARNGKFSAKTDEEISAAIREAFRHDIRIQGDEPEFTVKNGKVTFLGEVGNASTIKAAEEITRQIIGVKEIQNLARVNPSIITGDNQLAQHIRDAIEIDPLVNENSISVNVVDRVAKLHGEAASPYEAYRAEDIAASINGIAGVENKIEVSNGLNKEAMAERDAEIRQRILESYRWNVFVEPENIEVEVENGIAVLKGQVDSNTEFLTAEDLAYDAGATNVYNNIEIVTSDEMHLNRREK